jgi:hypothetical protein
MNPNNCQKAHCKCMQQSPCGNHHYSDCGWFDKPSLPKAGQEEREHPLVIEAELKALLAKHALFGLGEKEVIAFFSKTRKEAFEAGVRGKDQAYTERNKLVSFLARLYPAHIKYHPKEDLGWETDWRTIVCIHSPAGQMTWHLHDSEVSMFGFLNRKPDPFVSCEWDGHTTEEKYRRLAELPLALKQTN